MSVVVDVISWTCLLLGGGFCIVGGIGLLRLPDFYSRMHANGLTDTLGAGLILIGLMFQTIELLVLIKLILILLFLFFTSPTAGYALARAAFSHGLTPRLHDQEFKEELREGDLPITILSPPPAVEEPDGLD